MTVSNISEHDWNGIFEVQNQAYFAIEPESASVLRSKWLASPKTCFVSLSDQGRVEAYLLAHPWNEARPPKLAEVISPCDGSRLYLHDLAVHPQYTGRGLGHQLVSALLKQANLLGFKEIFLVSIQNSAPFWASFGFQVDPTASVSSSYGDQAVLMKKSL